MSTLEAEFLAHTARLRAQCAEAASLKCDLGTHMTGCGDLSDEARVRESRARAERELHRATTRAAETEYLLDAGPVLLHYHNDKRRDSVTSVDEDEWGFADAASEEVGVGEDDDGVDAGGRKRPAEVLNAAIQSSSRNNSGSIFHNFMARSGNSGQHKRWRREASSVPDLCASCGVPLVVNENESTVTCRRCWRTSFYIDSGMLSFPYGQSLETQPFAYKRSTHFTEKLSFLQGRSSITTTGSGTHTICQKRAKYPPTPPFWRFQHF